METSDEVGRCRWDHGVASATAAASGAERGRGWRVKRGKRTGAGGW